MHLLWPFCCFVSVNPHASRSAAHEQHHLHFPLTSGCLRRGGAASATPAKVADAFPCTAEECLMRKGWDPDKFTQGMLRKKSSCCSQRLFIMEEDIYHFSNYCLSERQTEILPYSSLKRNTAKFDPYSCAALGGLMAPRGICKLHNKTRKVEEVCTTP